MRLAIVGAGICGLTLAAALNRRAPDIALSIFEADTRSDSRAQGYAIGLKDESGLGVLEQLGLRSKLLATGSSRIRAFFITAQDGTELLAAASGAKKSTYRVKRRDIKHVLLEAIPEGTVHYDKRCVGYEQGEGGVRLNFADGSSVEADYVIACDGAGSTFRSAMLGPAKHYSGLTSIYGDALLEVEDEPLLDEGFFITLGDNGSSLLAYKQEGGVLFSYAFKAAEPEITDALSQASLLERVRSGTAGWHKLIERIVAGIAPGSLGTRAFYDWAPSEPLLDGRVLLIGDAAHPMTPFQGQAANVGMLDALEVASLIAKTREEQSLARGLLRQEAIIRRRGRKNVLQSRKTGLEFHTADPREQKQRAVILKSVNRAMKVSAALKRWIVPVREAWG